MWLVYHYNSKKMLIGLNFDEKAFNKDIAPYIHFIITTLLP